MHAKDERSGAGGDTRDAANRQVPARAGETSGATAPGAAARRASTPDGVGPGAAAPGTPLQRLFWFGALWLAGVAAVSLVAFLIRAVIMP